MDIRIMITGSRLRPAGVSVSVPRWRLPNSWAVGFSSGETASFLK